MNARDLEQQPTPVSLGTKPVGEIRSRWGWVEPSVWTDNMLTALEQGVKGSKWYSLIDKVYARANLRSAFAEVKRNGGSAGVDHQTVERYESRLQENLERVSQKLKEGSYVPQAIRRVWIPKPGHPQQQRPLGIPTVQDRVVQAALRHVLEPIFEREFAPVSYGFRPGRGCKDALREVQRLLHEGYVWVVDADLKSYFDTIPHEPLLQRLKEQVADSQVLGLVAAYLHQEVMETAKNWIPQQGTPQGAVLSPLLANLYLNPLDHQMVQRGYRMIRYADDLVILCRSQADAQSALEELAVWTKAQGLQLHPDKTRIVDASQPGGFDFLGYHFERGYRWPSPKSLKKVKDRLRAKTKRTQGNSLQALIADTNQTLKGWFEYFKHSHPTTFKPLDGWVRMRLRSILRQRQGRRGRGRGSDHQRWPNAFFAEHGLFSLATAYALACQSSWR